MSVRLESLAGALRARSPRLRRHALAICMLGALAANSAVAQNYRYISEIGTSGTGALDYPNDVQIDPASHNILVSDANHSRVVVFGPAGNYVNAFGSNGNGAGQLGYAAGIAIDPSSHNVFVSDYYNDRVEVFSASGTYLSQFSIGNGNTACAVAIQPGSHNILVSDGYSASVQIYNSAQTYVGSIGSAANFDYACSLAIAANGNILVGDQTNNNVQVFSSAGSFISAFGSAGSGDGQFATPSPGGIAVDQSNGNIVVADYGNNRVQIFDANGGYLSQFGGYGISAGQFNGPTGVAIDPATHNLFIADRGNNRVQEFTSCGPTLVSLSVLPLTQALNQSIFFSASIGNAVSPSGIVSMFSDDGTLVCTAVSYGDPQASCSGLMQLGTHAVTAVYSGNSSIPSGCSSATAVTVVPDLTQAPTSATLVGPPNGIDEGDVFTLDVTVSTNGIARAQSAAAPAPTGFFTFYDGSNVLADVPLAGAQATYTNRISGGAHTFSAKYSGDGSFTSASGNVSVSANTPSDEIHYSSFEVVQGN
jgi:DNA-binding beta-propeller fold protein YncE